MQMRWVCDIDSILGQIQIHSNQLAQLDTGS